MADLNNPQAVKFLNEQIRPLAEAARALKARVDAMSVDWYSGLNTLIPNDAGTNVVDGRSAEGVSQLTGADVHNLAANLLLNVLALNDQVVAKPCVRPLSVVG